MIVRHAGDERGDDGRRGEATAANNVAWRAKRSPHSTCKGPAPKPPATNPDDHERLAVQG